MQLNNDKYMLALWEQILVIDFNGTFNNGVNVLTLNGIKLRNYPMKRFSKNMFFQDRKSQTMWVD